jgi:N-acyl-D-aspartate/D-glutamate deacylase
VSAFDLLVAGGVLIDGTTAAARRADVGVRGKRIAAIGDLSADQSARRIDARGRVVCPGFIDAHSHSDLTLLSDGRALSKVHQGVTTEIVGNCGLGVAPLASPAAIDGVRQAIFLIDPDPAVAWRWHTMTDYFDQLESSGVALNVAALAGHLGIHASVAGYANEPPTATEVQQMQGLLDSALQQGAIGLSTGLIYAPAAYAGIDELVRLGEVVARYDRVFAMHLRNYADHLLEAVDEAIEVGAESGARMQASHLCVVGRRNWGKIQPALERMAAARANGVRFAADIYPYLAGSANLSQLLPGWAHEGGTAQMVDRLRTPADRARICTEWQTTLVQQWDEVMISWIRDGEDPGLVGKSVAAIAAERRTPPDTTALDLIAAAEGLVSMVAFGRSEDDLQTVLRDAHTLIGSDGLAVNPQGPSGTGLPHPRYYGCYPRLLGRYVREQHTLELADAIHRSTGRVAETFQLQDRGTLVPGAAADLVVFDPDAIADQATFIEPHRFPVGIDAVIVNGTLVIHAGEHTGARPGQVLRGGVGHA